jgi:hypothetical protein
MPKTGFLAQWEIINPNICVHKIKQNITNVHFFVFVFFVYTKKTVYTKKNSVHKKNKIKKIKQFVCFPHIPSSDLSPGNI